MQAITEPATVDELHARYKLARRKIDSAGLAYAEAVALAARWLDEPRTERHAPLRIEVSEPEPVGSISIEVTTNDSQSVTITSNRPIEARAILRVVTEVISEPKRITIEQIQRAICADYGVTKMDLKSHRRTAILVRPRQVGYFLSRTLTDRSFPDIARRFGGRDHTSALSGYHKIRRLLESDTELQQRIARLTAMLGGQINE